MNFRVEHHAVITPSGKLFHRCRTKDIAKRECDLLNAELKPLVDLLREAHGRLGNTAFPWLAKRIRDVLAKEEQ